MDKNSKSVTSLFIVLALLALIALALSVGQKNNTGNDDPLTPGLAEQINQINTVRLTGGGDTLIAEIRNTDDKWVVANADNYPVDIAVLRSFLLALAEAKVVETTTALADNYARIGVTDISSADATGVQVELVGADEPLVLLIGNTSSGNTTFVRRVGEKQSWRVSRTLQPSHSTSDWLNRSVIDLPAVEILSVKITHADGEVVAIDKSGTGYILADQPADQPLQSPSLLNRIAGVLDNVELDEVRSVDAQNNSPVKPVASVSVQSVNGLVVNIDAVAQEESVWLTFDIDFDAEMVTDAQSTESSDPDTTTEPAASAQAQELNDRLKGWAFRIPTYKSDWLLKRNTDLLQDDDA